MFYGNLTVEQLEKILGINFRDSEKKRLNELRQDFATVIEGSGKIHIFEIPLTVDCCETVFEEVKEMISRYYKDGSTSVRLNIGSTNPKHGN